MELLQELTERLAIPGLPGWSGLVLLLLAGLAIIAFLLMPFSVFGVKGRLESIEAQLDDIQAEIRSLTLRLPEPGRRARPPAPEDDWVEPPSLHRAPRDDSRAPRVTPPIPPPPAMPEREPRVTRAEPRLDWPRR